MPSGPLCMRNRLRWRKPKAIIGTSCVQTDTRTLRNVLLVMYVYREKCHYSLFCAEHDWCYDENYGERFKNLVEAKNNI